MILGNTTLGATFPRSGDIKEPVINGLPVHEDGDVALDSAD
jgi:hypothetical protein